MLMLSHTKINKDVSHHQYMIHDVYTKHRFQIQVNLQVQTNTIQIQKHQLHKI